MKKRYILLAVVLLIAVLAYSQRAALSMRIMERGLEAAMGANAIDELGDGLHLTLCGAGGPLPHPKRSGPCVAIMAGSSMYIVDTGTNGARNLARLRYGLGQIEAVFLTHFHSDHIDGLGEFATLRWVQGNHLEPLPVIGPAGVEDITDGFNRAYARDAVYRNDHHGDSVAPLSGTGMVAVPFPEPAAGELETVFEKDGLVVQMLLVDHHPVSPAVGYLFSFKGRSILISGDTSYSTNIEELAKDVDLLVHEALAPNLVNLMNRSATNTGNAGMAKITHDILDYHASPVEAAKTARNADVGHLLYYHIVPPLIIPGLEAAWLEGVDDIFPDYTLGEDGTSFTLPPDSDEIILTRDSM